MIKLNNRKLLRYKMHVIYWLFTLFLANRYLLDNIEHNFIFHAGNHLPISPAAWEVFPDPGYLVCLYVPTSKPLSWMVWLALPFCAQIPPQPRLLRLLRVGTMADYKVLSDNMMHADIRTTDDTDAMLSSKEVRKRIAGLFSTTNHASQTTRPEGLEKMSNEQVSQMLVEVAKRLSK